MPYKHRHVHHKRRWYVEYARSGISHCHKCHDLITKSSVRIARVVPAASFDGDIEVWYHPRCMFADTWQHPIYTDQVEGLVDLLEEDQDHIRSLVKQFGADNPHFSKLHSGLIVDYARSRVSECRGCFRPIDKDELRLGMLIQAPEEAYFHSVIPEWHHLFCFFNRPDYWDLDVESVRQFAGYRLIDRDELRIIDDLIRMKNDGEKIPGSRRVSRAWKLKEEGKITPRRYVKRALGM